MNCLCEALGVALPGNGTILATSPARDAARPRSGATGARAARAMASASATSSPPRQSTTPSRSTSRWADRRTRCCTCSRSRTRRDSTIQSRASTRSPSACRISRRSSPAWDGDRQWHIAGRPRRRRRPGDSAELARKPGTLASRRAHGHRARRWRRISKVCRTAIRDCIRPIDEPARAARRARGALRLARAGGRSHQGGRGGRSTRWCSAAPRACSTARRTRLNAVCAGDLESGRCRGRAQRRAARRARDARDARSSPRCSRACRWAPTLRSSPMDDSPAERAGCASATLSPEAAEGGAIGLVEDGDMISIDLRRATHGSSRSRATSSRRDARDGSHPAEVSRADGSRAIRGW